MRAIDRGADGTFDERTSAHFRLFQDVDIDQTGGFHGSRRFEQTVLAELERAYESLDRLLGLRPSRRIDVVIYDPDTFDRQFVGLFRYPIAGFFGDTIHIRGDVRLSGNLRHVLHHELVHAALQAEAPSLVFPGWMNEGLAEWFEARALGKRGLNGAERHYLVSAHRGSGLLGFASLSSPSFSHLGPNAASLAYLQSYAFIDFLARSHGERKLDQMVATMIRTRDLDRSLRRVFRADLARLETRFFEELN